MSPIAELDERSSYLRSLVVDALEGGGRGHVGSALSLIEILRVLYDDVLDVRPSDPGWEDRDRCILSKGHGCLALYAILADKGFFPVSQLAQQCKRDALLGGHPESHIPGVEASTGALGHGLSIAVGIAIAVRMQRRKSRVFAILGDGELDEGSVWEAALSAGKHRLNNLSAIIDYNKLQSYGAVEEVMPLEPLDKKLEAFGFSVRHVDGHDTAALRDTLRALPFDGHRPNAIIAHTIKGKGVHFAEHNAAWHHKAKVDRGTVAELRRALEKA